MATAEILSLISTICFIISGVCAAIAVIFWIVFKIPTVIGDLSGRTARKSIAKMRSINEKSGGRGYRPSTTNARRGKLTDTMSPGTSEGARKSVPAQAVQPVKQQVTTEETALLEENASEQMPETGLLADNLARTEFAPQTELLAESDSTELLADANATELLEDPNATELLEDPNATELLEDPDATDLLNGAAVTESLADSVQPTIRRPGWVEMTLLDEVMLIHTDEVL